MLVSVPGLLGIVFCIFVVFILVMRTLRRRRTPDKPVNFDFRLEELQGLHESGQLTSEEFERARAVVLTRRMGRRAEPPS
jgi:hypothetical protein